MRRADDLSAADKSDFRVRGRWLFDTWRPGPLRAGLAAATDSLRGAR